MKPPRGKPAQRAGYTLVLFLMMFFGLMGLAALVIDLGFARLTQRQMQSAVDSAALEGLRWRDVQQSQSPWQDLPPAWLADSDFQNQTGYQTGSGTMSQQQCDLVRRWAASNVTTSMFSDYLDPSGGTMHYGAGPVVQFQDAPSYVPQVNAAQTMVISGTPVYQPTRADGTRGLELNYSPGAQPVNEQYGDMTSGTYGSNTTYDGTLSADEDGNYDRRDYTTSVGTADSASAPAFLVRMRRTNNPGGWDSIGTISSSGTTVPFLFGWGSMMARSGSVTVAQSGSGNQLSVASGVTVRATAIAAAGSAQFSTSGTYTVGLAKMAGPPYQSVPGLAPLALTATAWASLAASNGTLQVQSDGSIVAGGATVGFAIVPSLLEIGQQVEQVGGPSTSIASTNASGLSSYYDTLTVTPSGSSGQTLLCLSQYVPLCDANFTVIGFGYVQSWTWQGDASGGTLTLTKGSSPQPVGYGNISAAIAPGLPQDAAATNIATVFTEHEGLIDPIYAPVVYAPVLVNHYIGPTNP